MRPVRDARRMQADHAPRYRLPAHKIPVDIVEHFIAVDIAVVVGHGNRERVIVEQAWHKAADHKIVRFKGLMHGRRLMNPPSNGFEVVYRKRIGITATVPAYDIEGMMAI